MKNEILVSTGALIGRPNGRDYRLLKDLAGKIDSDGFEFMMYSNWYDRVDEIIGFLKENGYHIPVFHCQKSIGESISKGTEEDIGDALERFRINVYMANAVGAGKMVMHLWDGITSDSNFESNVRMYPVLRDIAGENGIRLMVENVVCNRMDPLTHFCELAEKYPDIDFIFDTKMAAFHGQLELLYKKEYEWLWKDGHIQHYHLNDYGGGIMDWQNLRTLPIGKGNIDFDSFFEFLKKTGYTGTYTLESTAFGSDGSVDTEMLNEQIRTVRKKLSFDATA